MKWKSRTFNQLTPHELHGILSVRAEVFVVEQKCAYQDPDEKDEHAHHFFCEENGKILAYARLLPPGISYDSAAIGRVVTSPAARGKGLGIELMKRSINETHQLFGKGKITISAQLYLEKFYTDLGFKRVSDVYPEDDIPHIKMIHE